MKKAIITLLVFLGLDLFVLIYGHNSTPSNVVYIIIDFLVIITIEIAVYGCFVIYELSKNGDKRE